MIQLQRANSAKNSSCALLTSCTCLFHSSARSNRLLSFSKYSTICRPSNTQTFRKNFRPSLLSSSAPCCIFETISDHQQIRWKSSSSTKWLSRQSKDKFTARARVEGLMSRAAYKLIELDEKYRLFKKGMTIVDLGFAPGSWSQVAAKRVLPGGRVIGVDILPCRPPRGVSAIQGNFLSKGVQDELKLLLENPLAGQQNSVLKKSGKKQPDEVVDNDSNIPQGRGNFTEEELKNFEVLGDLFDKVSYIELERRESAQLDAAAEANRIKEEEEKQEQQNTSTNNEKNIVSEDTKKSQSEETAQQKKQESSHKYSVDVVLSDMCEPWPQTTGFWLRTINDPFLRMMNTSGNALRDHTLSIVSFFSNFDFTNY